MVESAGVRILGGETDLAVLDGARSPRSWGLNLVPDPIHVPVLLLDLDHDLRIRAIREVITPCIDVVMTRDRRSSSRRSGPRSDWSSSPEPESLR